jgi:hypothetical protein
MNWEIILEYIRPELFILVAFLWCIGLFLKLAPWFKQDWQIPYILLLISIIFTILYISIVNGQGFAAAVIIAAIIQAVLIAALAVFGNELLKQAIQKRIDDKYPKVGDD